MSMDLLTQAIDENLLQQLRSVELGNETYERDTTLVAGTLRIHPRSTIRIKSGATLTIQCETLIVAGSVFFDARGENGIDGIPGGEPLPGWISGLHHDDHERRHREWIAALNSSHPDSDGKPATPGTNGGPGGHVKIFYRRLGEGSQIGNVRFSVIGGNPGKAAEGGLGRVLICGSPSHSGTEQARRPSGASWSGTQGSEGSFVLQRTP